MLRNLFVAGLVCGIALWAGPLLAADTPVEAFPMQTSIVLRVKSPKATVDKLADAADKLQPGMGAQVQAFSIALGSLISNPTLDGVDMESDWWAAVFLSADDAPRIVFAIPAKKLDDMEAAVGKNSPFIKYEKWGIYSSDADAIGEIKERIGGKGKSIKTLVNAPTKAVLDGGDISLFLNAIELKKIYADTLTSGKTFLQGILGQAAEASGQTNPGGAQALTEVGGQLMNALFQGIDDTEGLAVTLAIADEAIRFEQFATVKDKSPSSELLKSNPGSEMKSLSSLPPSSLGYFGMHFDMKALAAWAMPFAAKVQNADAETSKTLEQLQSQMAKLMSGPMIGAFNIGSKKGERGSVVLINEVSDAKKMQELSRKFLAASGKIKPSGMAQTITLEPDAEKYGKNSADVSTITQKFDDENTNDVYRKIVGLLLGDKGIVTRSVYLKDRVVQMIGGDKTQMAAALNGIDGKASSGDSASAFDKTRKQLGEKPNLVALVDLTGLAKALAKLIKETPDTIELPFDTASLEGMDFPPSYIGFSVALEPTSAHIRTVIPLEQIQGIIKIVIAVWTAQ